MQSIAGKKIELIIPFLDADGNVKRSEIYTIEEIDPYQEFDIDYYYSKILEKENELQGLNMQLREFLTKKVFSNKQELFEFAELGKEIVKELKDSPLYEAAVSFYHVIGQLMIYRLDLKKK